jgi:hypothetical protein
MLSTQVPFSGVLPRVYVTRHKFGYFLLLSVAVSRVFGIAAPLKISKEKQHNDQHKQSKIRTCDNQPLPNPSITASLNNII